MARKASLARDVYGRKDREGAALFEGRRPKAGPVRTHAIVGQAKCCGRYVSDPDQLRTCESCASHRKGPINKDSLMEVEAWKTRSPLIACGRIA